MSDIAVPEQRVAAAPPAPGPEIAREAQVAEVPAAPFATAAAVQPSATGGPAAPPMPAAGPAFTPVPLVDGQAPGQENGDGTATEGLRTTCTTAQLRRFIKSRPWVPMHELRRRFGIWGVDDDVTPIRVGEHTLFIGLPAAEGRMMGELLAGGDVGYELSLDPVTPVVVGVYPMRPVPRS